VGVQIQIVVVAARAVAATTLVASRVAVQKKDVGIVAAVALVATSNVVQKVANSFK
jgi:hypothetical protein